MNVRTPKRKKEAEENQIELNNELMNWILYRRAKYWRVTEKKLQEKALEKKNSIPLIMSAI